MTTIETTGFIGTKAVKKLREQKLKNGLAFMINVQELASNHCYLEYPNGIIKLVKVEHGSKEILEIRELTSDEADKLRKRFHFSPVEFNA